MKWKLAFFAAALLMGCGADAWDEAEDAMVETEDLAVELKDYIPVKPRAESPWGIASSAKSSNALQEWLPQMEDAGFTWLRGFDRGKAEEKLSFASDLGLEISGIASMTINGAFPVKDLEKYKAYVKKLVNKCRAQVKYWEVWNEPPNFSTDKSPESYAKTVVAAYDAVKEADPQAKVGLAVHSANLGFMAQALKAGAAGHYDYVTLHPYELFERVRLGWDVPYLNLPNTTRKVLAELDPAKKDVPIWYTEIGTSVENGIDATTHAELAVKAYVLGIAGGAHRIHWFEGRDGDSGPYGLLTSKNQVRPAFKAMKQLIAAVGDKPRYRGWVLFNGKHNAFVFDRPSGKKDPFLIVWSAPGAEETVSIKTAVNAIDMVTGARGKTKSVAVSTTPTILTGIPLAWAVTATNNRSKPFPWGGDYSKAKSVSYQAGKAAGLHIEEPRVVNINGVKAHDASFRPKVSFAVDGNFSSGTTQAVRITAVVRRNSNDTSAGFNLKYECRNGSQGWCGGPGWYSVPKGTGWTTQTWTIHDATFFSNFGYNFVFDSDSRDKSKYSVRSVTVEKI